MEILLPSASFEARLFANDLLRLSPDGRPTAAAALSHVFFNQQHQTRSGARLCPGLTLEIGSACLAGSAQLGKMGNGAAECPPPDEPVRLHGASGRHRRDEGENFKAQKSCRVFFPSAQAIPTPVLF